jgi:flagellin-specific chaperone FliS
MTRKDIIIMSRRELKRLHIIKKVLEKEITQVEAASLTDLSTRQVSRIKMRVESEGDSGIIHRLRGQPSNRTTDPKIKEKALKLFKEKYPDFGPTLASEKLLERDKIKVNDETLRLWLIGSQIPYKQRKKRPHRQWRQRKGFSGEMLLLDGSHHDWFEGRGPKCVLMGYIDDATGRPFGRLYDYEGTIPAMDSFKRYVEKNGLPMSVYLDKHQTYKSNKALTIEEELSGEEEALSKFGKILRELEVKLIYADSPQAKGRIERLFETLQDRLVKEMRLRDIKTTEEGNKFLEWYLPRYAQRFGVKPAKATNLHRPSPTEAELDRIFRIRTERVLRNDFTIAHNKRLYQIEDNIRARKVVVEEKIDGSIELQYQGTYLKFHEIRQRPEKETVEKCRIGIKKVFIPAADHPWRSYQINPQEEKVGQKEKELRLQTET